MYMGGIPEDILVNKSKVECSVSNDNWGVIYLMCISPMRLIKQIILSQ